MGAYSTAMKLDQYRSDPALVEYAAKLLSQPRFKVLLDTLLEEHPRFYREGIPTRDETASHKLGRIEGYDEFVANLLAAGTSAGFDKPLPDATFENIKPQ